MGLESDATRIKQLKAIVGFVGTLLALGFAGAVYLGRFALADDLDKHVSTSDAHFNAVDIKGAEIQRALQDIESDIHWMQDRMDTNSTLPTHRKGHDE